MVAPLPPRCLYKVICTSVPVALPLTSGIGPPALPLMMLTIAAIFGSQYVRMQALLISYRVKGLSLVSTAQLLPLTRSIALHHVRVSVMAITDTAGFRPLIASLAELSSLFPFSPLVCMIFQWRFDISTL